MNPMLSELERPSGAPSHDRVLGKSIPVMPENDKPQIDLGEAGRIFDLIHNRERAEGGPDYAVGALVDSANEFFENNQTPETLDSATTAVEVAALEILNGVDFDQSVRALNKVPPVPLVAGLRAIDQADPSGEAVKEITRAMDGVQEKAPSAEIQTKPEKVELTLDEIKQKLDSTEGDPYARMRLINSIINSEAGPRYLLKHDELYALVESVPDRIIDQKLSEEDAGSLRLLVDTMSKRPINKQTLGAQGKSVRILEKIEGSDPLSWRGKLRAGELVSETANRYSDKQFLAYVTLINQRTEMLTKIDTDIFLNEREEAKESYNRTAYEAVKHVLDLDKNPHLIDLAETYFAGDIQDYGFSIEGGGARRIADKGHRDILSFLENVGYIGADGIGRLHAELGIVNVGSYTPNTLKNMLNILHHPQDYKSGVGVIVRGINGDYNGANRQLTQSRDLDRVLCFEVGQMTDIAKINELLDSLRLPIKRLTLNGHGGEEGIFLSRDLLLKRDEDFMNQPTLKKLFERIIADHNGVRNIILSSCSQGKSYDKRGSMAQVISKVNTNATVTASPRDSYLFPGNSLGEFEVRTNPHEPLVNFLETHKNVPGFRRLTKYLQDPSRLKPGIIRVKNGEKLTLAGSKIYVGGESR